MRNDEDEIIDRLRNQLEDLRVDQANIRRQGDAVEALLNTAVARAVRGRRLSPVSVVPNTTYFNIGTTESIGRRIVVGKIGRAHV